MICLTYFFGTLRPDFGDGRLPITDHGIGIEKCPWATLLEYFDGRVAIESIEAMVEQFAVRFVRRVGYGGRALLTIKHRWHVRGCGRRRSCTGRCSRGNCEQDRIRILG